MCRAAVSVGAGGAGACKVCRITSQRLSAAIATIVATVATTRGIRKATLLLGTRISSTFDPRCWVVRPFARAKRVLVSVTIIEAAISISARLCRACVTSLASGIVLVGSSTCGGVSGCRACIIGFTALIRCTLARPLCRSCNVRAFSVVT
jgi:hypothetical protein